MTPWILSSLPSGVAHGSCARSSTTRMMPSVSCVNVLFGSCLEACVIRELFGGVGDAVWIEPPFYCDYGTNIVLGSNVYFNFNCVILDPASVTIGDNAMFGPAVQIYTATHPINASDRRAGREFAQSIEIGPDVWVGGGAIISPGVHIGARSVIGAGSVVTRDIPETPAA